MLTERLAHNGAISLTGTAFAAIAALAVTALVGNSAGAYGTGQFFQALAVFTILSQLLRLGTNSGIVRQLAAQDAFQRHGEAWRTVVVAVIPVTAAAALVAAVVFVFSHQLAVVLSVPGEEDSLAALLRNMAPFIACAAVLGVLQTVVRMVRGVTAFTVLQSVLTPLSRLVGVATAVVVTNSVSSILWGWMVPLPLWLLVTLGVLANPLRADWRRRRESTMSFREEARSFWGFSGARAVGSALETALEWADVLLVAAITSPTAAGIYAVATRTIRAGQVVDRSMRIAVSPAISGLLAQGKLAEARDLHTKVTRAMVLATWPFYLTLATLGSAVLSIFGPEFREGAVVLAILAGAMMVQSAAGMLQSVLLQGGRSSWQMYNKAAALTLNVGLNLLLVPIFGIVGAAVTWAVGVLAETSIAAWQVHRRMGVTLEPRRLVSAMGLALVVWGAGGLAIRSAFGDSLVVLVVGVALLGVVYAFVLWILRSRLGIRAVWAELPLLKRFA
ncbi:MAG: polysaccharide biosynthesis C-terminal domain-containing protein [Mycetocola sp.]